MTWITLYLSLIIAQNHCGLKLQQKSNKQVSSSTCVEDTYKCLKDTNTAAPKFSCLK